MSGRSGAMTSVFGIMLRILISNLCTSDDLISRRRAETGSIYIGIAIHYQLIH